jgi:transposase
MGILTHENDEEKLQVTYGYSKDARPDLKQIVIGMGVTPQRLPLISKVENGNLNDKTWNHQFINRLRSILSDQQWSNLTYVADSALVTPENIALLMTEPRLSFITRLPDTYGLSKELKDQAVRRGAWEDMGNISGSTGSASYRLQSFTRNLYGYNLRFVVVHSDQLKERQVQSLDRQVEKEQVAIHKKLQALEAKRFACEHDAEKAWTAFCKEHKWKWHELTFTVQEERYTLRRTTRGRPKAGTVPEEGVRWKIIVSPPRLNEKVVNEQKEKLGMFVLMSNHLEEGSWTHRKILQTYKGQDAAETRFRLLKDPAILDAVYVKYPRWIEALGTVFVMALPVCWNGAYGKISSTKLNRSSCQANEKARHQQGKCF